MRSDRHQRSCFMLEMIEMRAEENRSAGFNSFQRIVTAEFSKSSANYRHHRHTIKFAEFADCVQYQKTPSLPPSPPAAYHRLKATSPRLANNRRRRRKMPRCDYETGGAGAELINCLKNRGDL